MEGKNRKKEHSRRNTKKLILWIVSVLVIVVVLLLLLIPAFLSSEKGRRIILSKVNRSIDGKIDFSNLSIGWFKGVEVRDFRFDYGEGGILASIDMISSMPNYLSILAGNLSFGRTAIERPQVEINLQSHNLGGKVAEGSLPAGTKSNGENLVLLPVARIDLLVNNGQVKVKDGSETKVELSQINLEVKLRPAGEQTDFDIGMAVSGEEQAGEIKAKGQVKPDKGHGWNLEGASGKIDFEADGLELESLGGILALAGIDVEGKGTITGQVKSEISEGRLKELSGSIKGKDLYISGPVLKGDSLSSNSLRLEVNLTGRNDLLAIDKLQLETDWLQAEAQGVLPISIKSSGEFFRAGSGYDIKGKVACDVGAILSQMPRTFGVKEGMRITSGTLKADVKTFSKDGGRYITGEGRLEGLQGEFQGKVVSLSQPIKAEARISSSKAGVSFEKAVLTTGFGNITGKGSDKLFEYEAEFDLSKLQEELGQFIETKGYRVAGELAGSGKVAGGKDKIKVTGATQLKGFRLISPAGPGAQEPRADIGFSIFVEPKKGIVDVASFKANAGAGQVEINDGVLGFGEGREEVLDLPISAKVNLSKVMDFVSLFWSRSSQIKLAGMAESQVRLSRQEGYYQFVTDGTRISGLKIEYPGRKPFVQEEVLLTGVGKINPTRKTYQLKWELESPLIKTNGSIEKGFEEEQNKLEGKADLEYDWAAVRAIVGSFLPADFQIFGKRKDKIDFASKYPKENPEQFLSSLNAQTKLGFDRAEYLGLRFGATDIKIAAGNGMMGIGPIVSPVNEGQLNFEGVIDFHQKPAKLETDKELHIIRDVRINDETTKHFLRYLNPIFANSVGVSGTVSLSCQKLSIPLGAREKDKIYLKGRIWGDDINVRSSDFLGQLLSLAGAGVREQSLKIHPTEFVVKDGFVRYDNMQIDVGDNPINFRNAVIGLDKSYDMRIVLPWTLAGRTLHVGKQEKSERIELRLKAGPGEKPKVDLGKLIEDQGRKLLEQEGMKLLEDLLK